MINVKDQVYAGLSETFDNVTDSYPNEWAVMPAVQLTEEENRVYEEADGEETMSFFRFRVDIFDTRSTSPSALLVDAQMKRFGLRRTSCMDANDEPKYKHKIMRYEGIVDNATEIVSQELL